MSARGSDPGADQDITPRPQPVDLGPLGLHLSLAGEGVPRIGRNLFHPAVQHRRVQVEVASRLRDADPALPHQPKCLDLERTSELAPLYPVP